MNPFGFRVLGGYSWRDSVRFGSVRSVFDGIALDGIGLNRIGSDRIELVRVCVCVCVCVFPVPELDPDV